jgi:hypothetical protein
MRCPQCGEQVTVGNSIRAVILDIQDHMTVMLAHVDALRGASKNNPVNRPFETEQVIGSAKAAIHLAQALIILIEVFDPDEEEADAIPLLPRNMPRNHLRNGESGMTLTP